MRLFDRRPKVDLQTFCLAFYDSVVHIDPQKRVAYWDDNFSALETPIKSHLPAGVSPEALAAEMTAINLELFGLAWSHVMKKDKFLLPEAELLKRYLEEKRQTTLWETIGEYNEAVCESSTAITQGTRSKRAWITFSNGYRTDLLKKWIERGADLTCAARVVKRELTDVAWEQLFTVTKIMSTLMGRLGQELKDDEFGTQLGRATVGLYVGARDLIKNVRIQV